jgi:hypothetical protein
MLASGSGSLVLKHVTYAAGRSPGMVDTDENGATRTGGVTMKSTLSWAGSPSSTLKIASVATSRGTDVCPAAACNYNGSYNLASTQTSCPGCTNQGRGYGGVYTATPGANDIDGVNPNFVDSTRKLENFDQKYLGLPAHTAWSANATYAPGEFVSNSDPGVYAGERLNYRCINSAGCTGLGAPGVAGTAWRDNWEFAALSRIADAAYAQTQYSDCSLNVNGAYVIQTLVAWVITGFRPQASAYLRAGEGGSNIGAEAPAGCTAAPSVSRSVNIAAGTAK